MQFLLYILLFGYALPAILFLVLTWILELFAMLYLKISHKQLITEYRGFSFLYMIRGALLPITNIELCYKAIRCIWIVNSIKAKDGFRYLRVFWHRSLKSTYRKLITWLNQPIEPWQQEFIVKFFSVLGRIGFIIVLATFVFFAYIALDQDQDLAFVIIMGQLYLILNLGWPND